MVGILKALTEEANRGSQQGLLFKLKNYKLYDFLNLALQCLKISYCCLEQLYFDLKAKTGTIISEMNIYQ